MKTKQKIDTGVALVLILIGIIMVILPTIGIVNIKWSLIVLFGLYTIINFVQYILTRESKDIEGLLTTIFSICPLVMSCIMDTKLAGNIALILMIWVTLMSVAKLKKADYYNDRNDRMWKLRILLLALFIISGILVAINLEYGENVQILLIGFFMLVHGIMELIDPIVKTLINHG